MDLHALVKELWLLLRLMLAGRYDLPTFEHFQFLLRVWTNNRTMAQQEWPAKLKGLILEYHLHLETPKGVDDLLTRAKLADQTAVGYLVPNQSAPGKFLQNGRLVQPHSPVLKQLWNQLLENSNLIGESLYEYDPSLVLELDEDSPSPPSGQHPANALAFPPGFYVLRKEMRSPNKREVWHEYNYAYDPGLAALTSNLNALLPQILEKPFFYVCSNAHSWALTGGLDLGKKLRDKHKDDQKKHGKPNSGPQATGNDRPEPPDRVDDAIEQYLSQERQAVILDSYKSLSPVEQEMLCQRHPEGKKSNLPTFEDISYVIEGPDIHDPTHGTIPEHRVKFVDQILSTYQTRDSREKRIGDTRRAFIGFWMNQVVGHMKAKLAVIDARFDQLGDEEFVEMLTARDAAVAAEGKEVEARMAEAKAKAAAAVSDVEMP